MKYLIKESENKNKMKYKNNKNKKIRKRLIRLGVNNIKIEYIRFVILRILLTRI